MTHYIFRNTVIVVIYLWRMSNSKIEQFNVDFIVFKSINHGNANSQQI